MHDQPAGSDPTAEAVDILTAMRQFIRATSPEEWGIILNAQRAILLRPDTLYVLKSSAENAHRKGEFSLAAQMDVLYNFLETARTYGIQRAVETEKNDENKSPTQ